MDSVLPDNPTQSAETKPREQAADIPSGSGTLLIINPASGQKDFEKARDQITAFFDSRNLSVEIKETKGEGDAMEWARSAEGYTRIVVAGGDGTVMEAMSGSIENKSQIPLAQLPLGTANLLARALAIPKDLDEALEIAVESGVATQMDVGYLPEINRYFALVAGSGWDAEMIDDADRELKNRLGFFAYVLSGVKHLFGLKRSRIRITIDGKKRFFRAHTVMAINVGEIHKSGIALGKDLSPHDGKLDLVIASTHSTFGLIRILFRILFRKYDGSPELRYFSASKIRVEADPPLKLEIDGEAIGQTPFEAHAVPKGVRLIVPREYCESKKIEFEELLGSSY